MEKDALLKIILQDIRELDMLVNTFTGKPDIPDAFIKLSKSKIKGILDEIELLEGILNSQEIRQPFVTEKQIEVEEEIFIIEEKEEDVPPPVVEIKKTPVEEAKPVEETVYIEKPETFKTVTETKPEQPVVQKEKQPTPPVTLGDKLMSGNQSLYDTLSKEQSPVSLFQKPVKDIKSAIGINDRYYFQRELFDGNAELFNSVIEQLNSMENMESAAAFLAGNFTWDENNEAVMSFMDIVKRRYL